MRVCQVQGGAVPVGETVGNKRYALLDAVRGATLVSMIAYHASWDFIYLFEMDWPWYRGTGVFLWQQSICWMFILLSGFCWPLGRRPLRRGLTLLAAGAGVSAATVLFVPDNVIRFGVLTLLGSCMLLLIPLERALRRMPAAAGLPVCLGFFLLTWGVPHGYLGCAALPLIQLPRTWYHGSLAAYFGLMPQDFFSTDYFPLFPWVFLFGAGYFTCRICDRYGLLNRLPPLRLPLLNALGRRSLLVYILHQPVLYLLLSACLRAPFIG